MARTDWYNTNENIQYPFVPYTEDETELTTNDILDCGFFLKNSKSAKSGTEAVWLHSKQLTNSNVIYTFECSDGFTPLEFKFERKADWQCQWVSNDDWYGFITIGRSK